MHGGGSNRGESAERNERGEDCQLGRDDEVGDRAKTWKKSRKSSDEIWVGGEGGMGAAEVASNAKAISQSTSDGLNRHTKRVGVIFKTEDGTPAGILNNRRGRAERETAGPRRSDGEADRDGGKEIATLSGNIRANGRDGESDRLGKLGN